jgi:endonuclease YncB( thermonuclease family)
VRRFLNLGPYTPQPARPVRERGDARPHGPHSGPYPAPRHRRPESGQDFGGRARPLASELALGKTITIRVRDTDRYGRTVADVILPDGRSVDPEMVGAGTAWCDRKSTPAVSTLARLTSEGCR